MTDDELIASMFEEVKATTVKTVNGKPYVSDEQTLAEMDFAAACEPRRGFSGLTGLRMRRRACRKTWLNGSTPWKAAT